MKTYAAISIVPGSPCCKSALDVSRRRLLASSAPRLPLDTCSMPGQCKCRYHKFPDRRDGEDRRLMGDIDRSGWYSGTEKRRTRRGRRTAD